jgi:hypothetical protein
MRHGSSPVWRAFAATWEDLGPDRYFAARLGKLDRTLVLMRGMADLYQPT